jgi:hypothetical protein
MTAFHPATIDRDAFLTDLSNVLAAHAPDSAEVKAQLDRVAQDPELSRLAQTAVQLRRAYELEQKGLDPIRAFSAPYSPSPSPQPPPAASSVARLVLSGLGGAFGGLLLAFALLPSAVQFLSSRDAAASGKSPTPVVISAGDRNQIAQDVLAGLTESDLGGARTEAVRRALEVVAKNPDAFRSQIASEAASLVSAKLPMEPAALQRAIVEQAADRASGQIVAQLNTDDFRQAVASSVANNVRSDLGKFILSIPRDPSSPSNDEMSADQNKNYLEMFQNAIGSHRGSSGPDASPAREP